MFQYNNQKHQNHHLRRITTHFRYFGQILHLVYTKVTSSELNVYASVFPGSRTHGLYQLNYFLVHWNCVWFVLDGFLRKSELPIKWFPVDAPLCSWRLWKCNDSWKGRCRHRTGSWGRVPPVSLEKTEHNWPLVAVLEYVVAAVSVTWNTLSRSLSLFLIWCAAAYSSCTRSQCGGRKGVLSQYKLRFASLQFVKLHHPIFICLSSFYSMFVLFIDKGKCSVTNKM